MASRAHFQPMRNVFGWDYPAGAENDPDAPWNQKDPVLCCDCNGEGKRRCKHCLPGSATPTSECIECDGEGTIPCETCDAEGVETAREKAEIRADMLYDQMKDRQYEEASQPKSEQSNPIQ